MCVCVCGGRVWWAVRFLVCSFWAVCVVAVCGMRYGFWVVCV